MVTRYRQAGETARRQNFGSVKRYADASGATFRRPRLRRSGLPKADILQRRNVASKASPRLYFNQQDADRRVADIFCIVEWGSAAPVSFPRPLRDIKSLAGCQPNPKCAT